jgi:hypothetical protein
MDYTTPTGDKFQDIWLFQAIGFASGHGSCDLILHSN